MIDILIFVLGLMVLIIAAIIDIKTKEVPDYLNFSIMASILGIYLIYSITYLEWNYFLIPLAWFAVFIILGYAMYYTGQWGGGDSKTLMVMGLLFSFYPDFLRDYFNPVLEWPLPVIFLINLLIIGAIYGLIFSLVIAVRNRKDFYRELCRISANKKFKTIRNITFGFVLIFLISSFLSNNLLIRFGLLGTAFIVLIGFVLIVFAKIVEMSCMIKTIPVGKLTEGDWIVEDILGNRKNKEKSEMHKKDKDKYEKIRIAGPKDLGISKEQIKLLSKYKIKEVKVKYGIPFVPSFLLAAIFTWVFGNLLFYLI